MILLTNPNPPPDGPPDGARLLRLEYLSSPGQSDVAAWGGKVIGQNRFGLDFKGAFR